MPAEVGLPRNYRAEPRNAGLAFITGIQEMRACPAVTPRPCAQAVMAAPAPSPTVATAATAIIAAERLRFMMSPVVGYCPKWTGRRWACSGVVSVRAGVDAQGQQAHEHQGVDDRGADVGRPGGVRTPRRCTDRRTLRPPPRSVR